MWNLFWHYKSRGYSVRMSLRMARNRIKEAA